MTKLEKRLPHSTWDFLKEKCMDCYNENKNRPNPREGVGSFKVLACKKHAKAIREVYLALKGRRLLHK